MIRYPFPLILTLPLSLFLFTAPSCPLTFFIPFVLNLRPLTLVPTTPRWNLQGRKSGAPQAPTTTTTGSERRDSKMGCSPHVLRVCTQVLHEPCTADSHARDLSLQN
jgi:hypothetical protein